MAIDCSQLSSRTNFPDYVSLLFDISSHNLTKLARCRPEMCGALWGVGNPDISGIGMIVGYTMDLILGILLIAAVMITGNKSSFSRDQTSTEGPRSGPPYFFSNTEQTAQQHLSGTLLSKYKTPAKKSFKVYADSAIFLAVSIQIAAMVVLVRKDYGINANGLGGITVQITWNVSLLTMLPLILIACLPSIHMKRPLLRFFIVCICWVLFMYTFVSRMAANFGPSQIGPGSASVISASDWAIITNICLSGVRVPSPSETTALNVFGIGGSIFVSLLILGRFLFCLPRQTTDAKKTRRPGSLYAIIHNDRISFVLIFGVLAFGIPQIWAIIRLRVFQESMAFRASDGFADNEWTFGQVVAVVVFAPVLVEMVVQMPYFRTVG